MDPNSVSERPLRNGTFFFDDDPMAIFLVENQLFKVHRHFLIKNSEVFRDMFAHAGGRAGGANEGMTEDQPIPLPDVTVQEFEVLLRFFYEMTVQPIPSRSVPLLTLACNLEEKLALLSIAHRFNFSQIFQHIINEINADQMSVLERIRLGNKYDMNNWLSSAYKDIIDRSPEGKVTKEEAGALGLERVNELLQAKNFMLHEQLRKAELYRIYKTHALSCKRCSLCCDQIPPINDEGATTSTEEIVKKYFPSVQAGSR